MADEIEDHDGSTNNWFRQPPIQRQKWGQKQVLPHSDWGNLFFDLFYVAAAYNLAYIIKSDPSLVSLLYVLGCFGPLKSVWTLDTVYDAKFQSPEDVMHLVFDVFQLCITATAVLHIRPVSYMAAGSSNPEMFLYSLAITLGYLLHIIKFLEIKYWGAIGQTSAKYEAVTSILTILPSFACATAATVYSAVVFYGDGEHHDDHDDHGDHDDHDHSHRLLAGGADTHSDETMYYTPIILMLVAWLIGHVMIYPVRYVRGKGSEFKKYTVPVNIDFVIHRNGEWSMLMLGESVLSLLIVEVVDEIAAFYVTFYTGIVSVTMLQYLYFKSRPQHAEDHAMKRSRAAEHAFGFLFDCYSAALIIVGVSFKLLLKEYGYEASDVAHTGTSHLLRFLASGGGASKYSTEDRRQRISNFFCLSLAAIFLCLDLMSFVHQGVKAVVDESTGIAKRTSEGAALFMVVALRVACLLFIATACIYVTVPEAVALIGLASITLQVIVRFMIRKYFPSEKSHDHEHNGHHEEGSFEDHHH